MKKIFRAWLAGSGLALALVVFNYVGHGGAAAQQTFTAVTKEMLANPNPDDWLMYSPDVRRKQYIAVLTGEGLMTGGLIDQAKLQPPRRYNALYVLALP